MGGGTCWEYANGRKIYVFEKKKNHSQGVVCPCHGAIYMYMTIIFIFSENAWPIKAKLYVEHRLEERMEVHKDGQGHMAKMAAMAINSKNL